ncbi:hypothetical protein TGARI_313852 [Toxoplasma gondii ARI]|uniref:Uncharacterized protein n=1 Tax=Toxoplasma gondii ARI TaxID=1074872 RepID=A0A139Y8Y4_TOXGO|nr:hypothetical protein TGARI_313852 [Toxoplasma gondii ARI]
MDSLVPFSPPQLLSLGRQKERGNRNRFPVVFDRASTPSADPTRRRTCLGFVAEYERQASLSVGPEETETEAATFRSRGDTRRLSTPRLPPGLVRLLESLRALEGTQGRRRQQVNEAERNWREAATCREASSEKQLAQREEENAGNRGKAGITRCAAREVEPRLGGQMEPLTERNGVKMEEAETSKRNNASRTEDTKSAKRNIDERGAQKSQHTGHHCSSVGTLPDSQRRAVCCLEPPERLFVSPSETGERSNLAKTAITRCRNSCASSVTGTLPVSSSSVHPSSFSTHPLLRCPPGSFSSSLPFSALPSTDACSASLPSVVSASLPHAGTSLSSSAERAGAPSARPPLVLPSALAASSAFCSSSPSCEKRVACTALPSNSSVPLRASQDESDEREQSAGLTAFITAQKGVRQTLARCQCPADKLPCSSRRSSLVCSEETNGFLPIKGQRSSPARPEATAGKTASVHLCTSLPSASSFDQICRGTRRECPGEGDCRLVSTLCASHPSVSSVPQRDGLLPQFPQQFGCASKPWGEEEESVKKPLEHKGKQGDEETEKATNLACLSSCVSVSPSTGSSHFLSRLSGSLPSRSTTAGSPCPSSLSSSSSASPSPSFPSSRASSCSAPSCSLSSSSAPLLSSSSSYFSFPLSASANDPPLAQADKESAQERRSAMRSTTCAHLPSSLQSQVVATKGEGKKARKANEDAAEQTEEASVSWGTKRKEQGLNEGRQDFPRHASSEEKAKAADVNCSSARRRETECSLATLSFDSSPASSCVFSSFLHGHKCDEPAPPKNSSGRQIPPVPSEGALSDQRRRKPISPSSEKTLGRWGESNATNASDLRTNWASLAAVEPASPVLFFDPCSLWSPSRENKASLHLGSPSPVSDEVCEACRETEFLSRLSPSVPASPSALAGSARPCERGRGERLRLEDSSSASQVFSMGTHLSFACLPESTERPTLVASQTSEKSLFPLSPAPLLLEAEGARTASDEEEAVGTNDKERSPCESQRGGAPRCTLEELVGEADRGREDERGRPGTQSDVQLSRVTRDWHRSLQALRILQPELRALREVSSGREAEHLVSATRGDLGETGEGNEGKECRKGRGPSSCGMQAPASASLRRPSLLEKRKSGRTSGEAAEAVIKTRHVETSRHASQDEDGEHRRKDGRQAQESTLERSCPGEKRPATRREDARRSGHLFGIGLLLGNLVGKRQRAAFDCFKSCGSAGRRRPAGRAWSLDKQSGRMTHSGRAPRLRLDLERESSSLQLASGGERGRRATARRKTQLTRKDECVGGRGETQSEQELSCSERLKRAEEEGDRRQALRCPAVARQRSRKTRVLNRRDEKKEWRGEQDDERDSDREARTKSVRHATREQEGNRMQVGSLPHLMFLVEHSGTPRIRGTSRETGQGGNPPECRRQARTEEGEDDREEEAGDRKKAKGELREQEEEEGRRQKKELKAEEERQRRAALIAELGRRQSLLVERQKKMILRVEELENEIRVRRQTEKGLYRDLERHKNAEEALTNALAAANKAAEEQRRETETARQEVAELKTKLEVCEMDLEERTKEKRNVEAKQLVAHPVRERSSWRNRFVSYFAVKRAKVTAF